MSQQANTPDRLAWRLALPVLKGPSVTLREPTMDDVVDVFELLATADASRFGLDEEVTDVAAVEFVARAVDERTQGQSFTYLVTLSASQQIVGAIQVRGLDPTFETAEWEATMLPSARGTGTFAEAARLVGSLTFGTINTHRLEARVLLQNGRAHGALKKLGAVQEGVLRRAVRREGRAFDQILWSLLKEDWGRHWMSPGFRVH
jgi:RimJ/RimL family protein N-acetyltransferase